MQVESVGKIVGVAGAGAGAGAGADGRRPAEDGRRAAGGDRGRDYRGVDPGAGAGADDHQGAEGGAGAADRVRGSPHAGAGAEAPSCAHCSLAVPQKGYAKKGFQERLLLSD